MGLQYELNAFQVPKIFKFWQLRLERTKYLVKHRYNGGLVELGNVKELAETLKDILNTLEERSSKSWR